MESSHLDLSEEDQNALDKYRVIIQDITRVKSFLEKYKEDKNSIKNEIYRDLLSRLKYLKNRQTTTSKRIRLLYKKIYNN